MNLKITHGRQCVFPLLLGLLAIIISFFPGDASAQTYCTPSVTNRANYNVGMTNVTIGNINNSTTTNSQSTYNDYTSTYFTTHKPGATVNYSIKLGTGNSTAFIVYIDWNKDGTFAAAENVASNIGGTTTAGSTITGSFTVPSTQSPGVYRMRVVGDIGWQAVVPCKIEYSGEAEDYNMIVLHTSGVDAAAISKVSPANFVVGNNNISFQWFNLGADTIKTAEMGYQVGSSTPVTQSFTGNVLSGGSNTFAFSTAANISAGTHKLKIWVKKPNNVTSDKDVTNDTITFDICTPISGTYTIDKNGSGTSNFKSFQDAANKLSNCGISGPITFNVAAGNYDEAVTINTVAGTSATNTITFKGAGKFSTRLFSSLSSASNVLTIAKSGYISFENMTIENTSTAAGKNNVSLTEVTNSSFVNCIIKSGTTYNYPNANFSATNCNNLTLDKNRFEGGGYYNVWLNEYSNAYAYGGHKLTNNSIVKHYQYGLYSYGGFKNEYRNNYIDSANNNYSYPLYSFYEGGAIYNGNTFGPIGGYGNFIYYANSFRSTDAFEFINNIVNASGPNSYYALYFYYNYANVKVLHNTIYKGSYQYGYGFYNYSSPGGDLDFRNNSITVKGGEYGIYIGITNRFSYFENNQLDISGTSRAYGYYGADVSNYAGFIKAIQADGHGKGFTNKAMPFLSANDLHLDPSSPAPFGASLGITTDIDGDPRCLEAPTIGADETKYPFAAPVAGFTNADTIFVNNSVDFLNAVSAAAAYRHRWYVNGTMVTNKTHDLTYKFTSTGTYTIAVVSFACGTKDSFSKTITVYNPTRKPVADFSVDRNVISRTEIVNFKDLSTNGPSSWTWEITPKEVYDPSMGMVVPAYYYTNGTDSSSQNPVVGFDFAGSYNICLTATNALGSSAICKSRYIRVKESIEICNVSETVSNKNFGTITDDGGTTGNYSNNMKCNFLISPCSPSLGLKIKSFNLAAGDFLKLYDGSDKTAPKLYNESVFPDGLTGNATTIPGFPDSIISKSGKIYIEFTSNSNTNAPGFEMEWFADSFNTTPPVADFFIPDTICFGLDVPFMNKSKGFGNMYFWDVDGDSIADYTDENPVDYFLNTGSYQIMLIVENCGGRDTMVKNIFVVNPTTAPRPEFTVDITGPNAVTDVVKFTDHSFRCVDSWRWEFSPADVTFVNGTSASSQNPQVKFGSGGCYDVKLVAGFNGVEDSITKKCFINAVKFCTPVVSTLTSDIGISSVTIGNMSNGSSVADVAYTDYTATKQVTLQKRVPVSFSIKRQTSFNAMSVAIWIDMNQNGTFESGERVAFENALSGTSWNSSFTIPGTAKTGGTRLRIGTNLTNLPNLPCGTNRNGEFEDYRVFITEDNVPPVITMKGMDTVRIEQGTPYIDSGAVATDDLDGDITSRIVVTNPVNVQLLGLYRVTYNVTDSAGNKAAEVSRVVIVTPDTTAPVITLTGGDTVYVEVGTGTYAELGYTAIDPGNNMDITADVVVSGSVDVTTVGTYFITYAVQDEAGNPVTKLRTVIVRDTVKPVITLKGSDTVYHQIYTSYIDSGVTYTDNYWKTLSLNVISNVDTSKLGVYTIVYSVRDSSGNVATASRTVIVVDTEKPVITLNGADTVTVEVFSEYIERGATVADNFSQNLRVVITGTVDVTKLGFYPITYAAVDENGNAADSVTRIVHVVDTKAPVIKLIGSEYVQLRFGDTYTDSGYTVSDNYWPVSSIKVDTISNFKGDGTDIEGGYSIRYTATDSSGNTSSVVRIISVGVNGVEETTALQGSVNIFPNPAANGIFSIDVNLERAENVKVSIFNMLGQEIRTLHNGNLSSQRFNVEMSEKAGMYLVRIQTANGAITKPVILTK